MKVKCEVCGRKFHKKGIKSHIKYKHPSLAPAPPIGEVEEGSERDKVIERLLDILWMSLTLDQKQQAVFSLQLDGED